MRRGLTVMVLALLVSVLVGCGNGGQATAPPKVHPEASKVAIEFYHAYFLNQDFGRAWDISTEWVRATGSFHPLKTREEWVQFHSERDKPLPDRPYEIEEHKRVDGFVYLVSDNLRRRLIWVAQVDGEWRVQKWDHYDGGEIEW